MLGDLECTDKEYESEKGSSSCVLAVSPLSLFCRNFCRAQRGPRQGNCLNKKDVKRGMSHIQARYLILVGIETEFLKEAKCKK